MDKAESHNNIVVLKFDYLLYPGWRETVLLRIYRLISLISVFITQRTNPALFTF